VLINRRDILSLLPIAGSSAVSLLADLSNSQKPAVPQESGSQTSPADQPTFDFWTREIRNPDSAGTGTRSPGTAPRASFVYYDELRGFVTGSDIGDEGLRDAGDLDITINVDHVHPSLADQKRFVNLEGGSLRIDVQQGVPMRTLAERLAWTAIAGFLPENKKLPALKEMTFNPGTTWGKLQTVPLPEGGGRWAWNFFLQKRTGPFLRMFDVIRRSLNLAVPIFGLGLPAIAVTALTTVDSMVATLTKDERTEWLFQSPDVYFYATKRARDALEGSKLRLKKGMYVIMPSDKLSAFGKEQSGLTIKDGLIVPKNTPGLEVESAAKEVIKDITYLTVGVTARLRSPSR
jgi:hypothetical protein